MAPRSRASQSQPKASSSKKRPAPVEDDEEEEEEEEQEEEEGGGKGGKKVLSEEALSRIAYDIVRLALFHEQKKIGLSRTDINKKVIQEKHKAGARVFNDVFPLAQKILRKTFGMELFELRKSGKAADQDDDTGSANKKGKKRAIAEDEEEEAEEGEGKKKKKGSAQAGNSGVYMLRSILPPGLVERAFAIDEEVALKLGGSGAVVDFKIGDDVALMGVTWVILALILINGRVLDDHALRGHLKKLSISPTSILPSSSPIGTHHTLETFLPWLNQHKYLEKVKKDRSGPSQAANNNDGDGDASIKWEWGPRAEAEIGEVSLTEFIGDLQLPRGEVPEEESTQDKKKRLDNEKKARDVLRRQVTLAASAIGSGLRSR